MTPRYEHRICPDDPCLLQVRRVARLRRAGCRGRHSENWRRYELLDTPQRARHWLGLLKHGEMGTVVG